MRSEWPLRSVMPLFGIGQLLFCLASLGAAFVVLLIFACSSFAFVRLLMFEERASGALYFKIGKATSLTSRIKQFWPCELVAHDVRTDSQMALKREKELHKQFAAFRRPEAEIFLLNPMEVLQVRIAMNRS